MGRNWHEYRRSSRANEENDSQRNVGNGSIQQGFAPTCEDSYGTRGRTQRLREDFGLTDELELAMTKLSSCRPRYASRSRPLSHRVVEHVA